MGVSVSVRAVSASNGVSVSVSTVSVSNSVSVSVRIGRNFSVNHT